MVKQSDFEFRQQANLGQKTSYEYPILSSLAGTDRDISDAIAIFTYFKTKELVGDEIDFLIGLLNVLRLSHFATSEKVNEITKMGFMLPATESEYDGV